ncbi:MAG: hypothetical protein ACYCYK_11770 [Candidatus Dormibacteria bacterium]
MYSQGAAGVGAHFVGVISEPAPHDELGPPRQLVNLTVPAAKVSACGEFVALNNAKVVEIDSAARLPTATMAARASRRRTPPITRTLSLF